MQVTRKLNEIMRPYCLIITIKYSDAFVLVVSYSVSYTTQMNKLSITLYGLYI